MMLNLYKAQNYISLVNGFNFKVNLILILYIDLLFIDQLFN